LQTAGKKRTYSRANSSSIKYEKTVFSAQNDSHNPNHLRNANRSKTHRKEGKKFDKNQVKLFSSTKTASQKRTPKHAT